MPIAKIKASGTPNFMKTKEKIDTILERQFFKESFVPFPRASESPA